MLIIGVATPCITSFTLSPLLQYLKPCLLGLIYLAGLHLSEAMGALSFVASSHVFVPPTPFVTKFRHLTTRNLTAWPMQASSQLKTFYANVLYQTPMLTLCFMNGGTCHVLTATARPSLCLVELRGHLFLPCLLRMFRLIVFLQHLQRMLPNREQKCITINLSFLYPPFLLARQYTFKTLNLLRGTRSLVIRDSGWKPVFHTSMQTSSTCHSCHTL